MERLLEIIGPIDMTEDYGVVIEAENFWPVIQQIVKAAPEDWRNQLAGGDEKMLKQLVRTSCFYIFVSSFFNV